MVGAGAEIFETGAGAAQKWAGSATLILFMIGRTATPTWTEGTPSFTESTYSGDMGRGHFYVQNVF
jgi:hypothetical protein